MEFHANPVNLTKTENVDETEFVKFVAGDGKYATLHVREGKLVYSGDLPVDESAQMFFLQVGVHCAELFIDFFLPTHVHVKTQGVYEEIARGELQNATNHVFKEGDVIVTYRNEMGRCWYRFEDEFDDGRFEELPLNEDGL